MSLLLPAAAAAAIIVIIQLVSGATGVMVRDPAAPSVLRRAGWYWRLGMLTALAILAGVDQFTPFGPRAYGVAPALDGIGFVLAIALGEVTWPKPGGRVRTAELGQSRPPAPRRLALGVAAAIAAVAGLVIAGGRTAAADGRSVEVHWADGAAVAGPYPGWYYGLPIAVGLAALAVATWWSLRRIDARAALGEQLREDDWFARTAAKTRTLRGALAAVLLTFGGTALVMGAALHGLWDTAERNGVTTLVGTSLPALRWTGIALSVAGLAALVGAVVQASRTGWSAWRAARRTEPPRPRTEPS